MILSPRKKQIIQELFNKRVEELNCDKGGAIMMGGEPDDMIDEELEHIEEMREGLKL